MVSVIATSLVSLCSYVMVDVVCHLVMSDRGSWTVSSAVSLVMTGSTASVEFSNVMSH